MTDIQLPISTGSNSLLTLTLTRSTRLKLGKCSGGHTPTKLLME